MEESTVYENCMDILGSTIKESNSLASFLGEDEPETMEEWKKHWVGMPEFNQDDNPPYIKIYMSFRNKEDYDAFAKLIDQNLSEKTKSIWYPKLDRDENSLKRWIEDD